MTRIRSLVSQTLHLHEPPHRTALAFAVGVFIAFSPAYGLHTLSAIFCAWAFRLNLIALMTGSFLNNPWTVVPILGATFWTGFQFLGIPQGPPLQWDDLGFQSIYHQAMPYALPFFLGGVTLSVLGAVVGYPAAYLLILQYRARRPQPEGGAERLPHESPSD